MKGRPEKGTEDNPGRKKVKTESPAYEKQEQKVNTEAATTSNSEHEESRTIANENPGHNGEGRENPMGPGQVNYGQEQDIEDQGNEATNPRHNGAGREDPLEPVQVDNGQEQDIEDQGHDGDGCEDPSDPVQVNNGEEQDPENQRNGPTNAGQGREEPPSPEMEMLMLKAAMERWDQKHKVQGVLSITKEQAVPNGENFLSIVKRLTVKVILGSGRQATRRFILKEVPKAKIIKGICIDSGIFKAEINTYKIILKEMEHLMAEFGDTDDILWCQLIRYDPYYTILLEDLTEYGFKTVRRQSCLDYDHGVLAIRNIARFHAMAKVLQGRGIINIHENLPYSLISDSGTVKTFFFKGYEAVSNGIKKYWGNEWSEIADKLRLPLEYLIDKMLDIGRLDQNRFNVLNHGDCWSNNLMFKYDWKNKPMAVRFLDFQACHYNSPAIDLTYFIHQSMEPSVRRSRFNDLMENYYESLQLSFDKFKYTGTIPTFEEIMNEMERVSFFGLSMFTIRHAVVTTDMVDAMDLERILLTEGEEGINIDIYKDLALIERMGPDLKYIVDTHVR